MPRCHVSTTNSHDRANLGLESEEDKCFEGRAARLGLLVRDWETKVPVRIRRAYEAPSSDDGRRVLVERLWPRGIKKEDLRIDAWLRDVAPSNELRRWFQHDPARWGEFQRRYRQELRGGRQQELIDDLAEQASQGNLTLIFSAREERFNNAVALCEIIEERLKRHPAA
jgi:uncharacterized protein YeaO (DUF488 family)